MTIRTKERDVVGSGGRWRGEFRKWDSVVALNATLAERAVDTSKIEAADRAAELPS